MKLIIFLLTAFMALTSLAATVPTGDRTRTLTRPTVPLVTAVLDSTTLSRVVSALKPTITAIAKLDNAPLPHGVAEGGALDSEPYFEGSAVPSQGPASVTISIINSAGTALDLKVDDGAVQRLSAGGRYDMIRGGEWQGRAAFHKAGNAFFGDESLIESSYKKQPTVANGQYPIFDINVSYVDGFTYPIVCVCACEGDKELTGCGDDLFALGNRCDDYKNEACKNPHRASTASDQQPHPFFAPCRRRAYTFPADHDANSNGECQCGTARCTVGRASPRPPSQVEA